MSGFTTTVSKQAAPFCLFSDLPLLGDTVPMKDIRLGHAAILRRHTNSTWLYTSSSSWISIDIGALGQNRRGDKVYSRCTMASSLAYLLAITRS